MILKFTDAEDDGVAIESGAIVAVSVGRLAKPMSLDKLDVEAGYRDPHEVTIVHTLAGPLIVRQKAEMVLLVWQEALTITPGVEAHAATMGWLSQYFHPSVLKPPVPAGWNPKALPPREEIEP